MTYPLSELQYVCINTLELKNINVCMSCGLLRPKGMCARIAGIHLLTSTQYLMISQGAPSYNIIMLF